MRLRPLRLFGKGSFAVRAATLPEASATPVLKRVPFIASRQIDVWHCRANEPRGFWKAVVTAPPSVEWIPFAALAS